VADDRLVATVACFVLCGMIRGEDSGWAAAVRLTGSGRSIHGVGAGHGPPWPPLSEAEWQAAGSGL